MAMIGKFLHRMLDEKGIKLIDLSREYDIPISTLSGWYNDRSNAPLEFIMKLSEGTHVSVENIIANVYFEQSDLTPQDSDLSAAEKRLITYMRRMNPASRALLEKIAENMGSDSCFTN